MFTQVVFIIMPQNIIWMIRGAVKVWIRVEYHLSLTLICKKIWIWIQTSSSFNPIRDGGWKISSKTLKMASKWPQISWLFLFLYDLSEKQKNFLVFHSDFGCLEGGGGEHPPPHLTYIFNPIPNRVNHRFNTGGHNLFYLSWLQIFLVIRPNRSLVQQDLYLRRHRSVLILTAPLEGKHIDTYFVNLEGHGSPNLWKMKFQIWEKMMYSTGYPPKISDDYISVF